MPYLRYLGYSTGILLWICLTSSMAFAKPKKNLSFLDFKKVAYSQITPIRDVAVVYREGGNIFLLPPRERQLLQTTFLPDNKEFMTAATMDVAQSERYVLDESIPLPGWAGFFPIHNGMTMLLDGYNLGVAAFEPQRKWSFVSHRNIVLDLFKPASDSRGEPTRVETTAARRKLTNELKPLRGQSSVITGAVQMPEAWAKEKERRYMLLTRMPSFPFVTMRCELADATQCQVERACFAQGFAMQDVKGRQGLAVSEKRRQIIVGNRDKQMLQVFKYQDCFHIALIKEIELPTQIRKLRSIFVDAEDNLWLSTEGADDYRNASVYMWSAADW